MRTQEARLVFFSLAAILIILNGLTLAYALPEIGGSQVYCDSHLGCINVARDFSAYYEGAYRFIHNPSQVYQEGNVPSDYLILPNPQQFRYSPFFLLLFVPLVTIFNYHGAFVWFDVLQFLLLPMIAYLLFEIMKQGSEEGKVRKAELAGYSAVLVFTVLQPFIPSYSDLTFWSWSYFRLWSEGEARVLQTLLLVITFWLILKDSKISGLPFVLSSFDPRLSVLSLPLILYLCLKKRNLRKFTFSTLICLGIIYLPTMIFADLGVQFFQTIFIKDYAFYSYELIPLLAVLSLTATVFCLDILKAIKAGESGNFFVLKRAQHIKKKFH